ncbi:MAG: bifunctional adenosylcobinamide kinase/adenosylcobinamide-phosphate guanylyltransferase [Deltaproteobacteria bacterium]|nr:bifunctional adenosylcobinamide kinase/adenosylcobinamide-phosphate guanylyltransferase [Deltaproteobacteria bacterium]
MGQSTEKEITLVLGGARSGKSSWALRHAEETYETYLFLATAEVRDDEMAERVRLHKASRGSAWKLVEEPLNIAGVLQSEAVRTDVTLIDCMTIWLSNILLTKGKEAVGRYQERLLNVLTQRIGAVIMVSNEVGTGIVPEHPIGREFRDLAGVLNQKLAATADKVVMTVAGIPVRIK